jgi:tetratricopeptide (TPR) repeat protein
MVLLLSRWRGSLKLIILLAVLNFSATEFSAAQVLTVPTQQPEAQQQPTGQAATPAPPQIDPVIRAKIADELKEKKFDEAIADAKAILEKHPDSPQVNKLVGVVFLEAQKPADALTYFQKAQSLDSSDASVHALLLQAFAAMGDKTQRDGQRAILRGFHGDGKHPDLAGTQGFVIEMIPVGDRVVQAFEFYEPTGKFHFYYRFNVFDASDNLKRFYALESDDADQAIYAQQHPKEAAAGERRFSIDSYEQKKPDSVTQGLVGFIDGQPSYDELRARIVKLVLAEQTPATPTPGTTAPAAPK